MHADGWQISCIPDAHVEMERLLRAYGEFGMHLFVDPFNELFVRFVVKFC